MRPLSAVPLLALCVAAASQDLRLLDPMSHWGAAYDTARGRLVTLGVLGTTFEFDGVDWRQRALPELDFAEQQIVYDPLGAETILVGTRDGQPGLATWRYDGVAWTDLQPPAAPSARAGFAIAFDAARREIVLFGGFGSSVLAFDETWVFDVAANNWIQRQPGIRPAGRAFAEMVYDSARSRVVMLGGLDVGITAMETWEWDGFTWSLVPTPAALSLRRGMAMAFDSQRGRTVVHGGSDLANNAFGDLWEYDGVSWQQRAPAGATPPPTAWADSWFDPGTNEFVILGGVQNSPPSWAFTDDTWAYDGTQWQQRPTPPLRASVFPQSTSTALPNGNGLVSAGGYHGGPPPNTYIWQNGSWTRLVAQGPPARRNMTAATGGGRAWFFGGSDFAAALTFHNDLWAFDGASWTVVAAPGPSPRSGASLAFDTAAGELVLFGGFDAGTAPLGDTWVFDGVQWLQRQPAVSPSPRSRAAMAYDPVLDRTILAGGATLVPPGYFATDTWLWDGQGWAQVATAPIMPGEVAMAFDVQRQQAVLFTPDPTEILWESFTFDGQNWNPTTTPAFQPTQSGGSVIGFPYPRGLLLHESNRLLGVSQTPAEAQHYGAGCGANAPDLAAGARPRLGSSTFGVDVVRAPANSLAALLGAINPANVNVLGCTQLVQPGQAVLLLATSASGFATVPLPLPNNPAFVGVDLFYQAAALDPSAPNGFVLSRGLQITVGD